MGLKKEVIKRKDAYVSRVIIKKKTGLSYWGLHIGPPCKRKKTGKLLRAVS